MKAFRLLALRRLRQSPLRALIAALAVAGGVSLAVSTLITSASVSESVRDFGRTLAGPAPLRIVGASSRGGLSNESVAAARAVPGIEAVVPMVQVVSFVDEAEARTTVLVLGVDCGVEALVGDFGCDPAALAAAGDRPLLVGSGVPASGSLRTDLGRVDIAGVASTDLFDRLNEGRVVVYALEAAARRYLMDGRVDLAYVLPGTATREQIQTAVGDHNGVLDALDPPPEVEGILTTILPLFSLMAMFGLATGAVLVHNTVALSLEERRRQLAVSGALGAKPGFLLSSAVVEAALLGTLGGVLGVLGGTTIAGPIVESMGEFTVTEGGLVLERHVPASAAVVGVLLGAIVGGLAAISPARRALRLDVAAELSGRGAAAEAKPGKVAQRMAIWGSVGLLGVLLAWLGQRDGALEQWQAAVGPLGFLLVATAVAFFGAAAAPLTYGALHRAVAGSRLATARLALAELVREPRRAGTMALAVASPILVGFTTDGFVSSAEAAIGSDFEDEEVVSVATIDVGDGRDAYLPPDARARIAQLPGVAAVRAGINLTVGHRGPDLIAVEAYGGRDLSDFDAEDFVLGDPSQEAFDAGGALVGPGMARRHGLRPGDSVALPTPSGTVELPVLAVTQGGDFAGRSVELSLPTLERLYGPQPPNFVNVEVAEGTTEAELVATLEAERASIDPNLVIHTSDELVDSIVESIDSQMLPFRAMQQGLTFIAFVAVLTTLLLVGLQRQRQQGLIAAVGATPRDLGGVVVAQAGAVWLAALLNAIVLGPVVLWAMIQILPVVLGFRDPYTPDWSSLVGGGITAAIVTLLASVWPAWRASRTPVLESLRYE